MPDGGQGHRDVLVADLHAGDPAGRLPQALTGADAAGEAPADLGIEGIEGGRDGRFGVVARLDLHEAARPALGFSYVGELTEKDGLPDAAETGQPDVGGDVGSAPEDGGEPPDLAVPSSEAQRCNADPRSVRVSARHRAHYRNSFRSAAPGSAVNPQQRSHRSRPRERLRLPHRHPRSPRRRAGDARDAACRRRLHRRAAHRRWRAGRKCRPGRRGLFGHIASAPGLTERIGLEQDTNVSTTRRLLVLEESVSVYRPDRRLELLRAILERYLFDPGRTGRGGP